MYPGNFARTTPDKPAAINANTGETITYAQLDRRSTQLANWLRDRGLCPGDQIAAVVVNDVRAFEIYWAAVRSGLYVTFVNRHLVADEASYIINDCDAKVLFVSGQLAELADAIVPHTTGLLSRVSLRSELPHHLEYEAVVAEGSAVAPAEEPRGSDMLYSSGTTGRPKGIKTPLPDCDVSEPPGDPRMVLLRDRFGGSSDMVFFTPAPIYHSAPLRYTTATQGLGGTVVITERFDAQRCLQVLQDFEVTHSQWVPTHFVRMLKLPEDIRLSFDLHAMQVALHVGAPCPVDVKRAMIDWWGPILYEYYSATESIGTTMITSEEWLDKPGSVGQSGARSKGIVHICDPVGVELPSGEVGQVYFENSTWHFEYHNDPAKTLEAQHPKHVDWYTTGDIGYLDVDNYLFLTDRAKFMIISGGVNIYPQEIESCLAMHPKIADVAVIGVPDLDMGESVWAVVQPAEGCVGDEELESEIIEFCRARIAHFKCPRAVRFVSTLPRSEAGKLVKGRLAGQLSSQPRAAL